MGKAFLFNGVLIGRGFHQGGKGVQFLMYIIICQSSMLVDGGVYHGGKGVRFHFNARGVQWL